MIYLSLIESTAAGLAGRALSRLPAVLFRADLQPSAEESTDRVSHLFNQIKQARIAVRKRLDQFCISSDPWHFFSTSLKDNLGIALFFISLAGRAMANPSVRRPMYQEDANVSSLMSSNKNDSLVSDPWEKIVVTYISSNIVFGLILSKKIDAIIKVALFTIVSCTVLNVTRTAIFKLGNRLLNRIQGPNPPSQVEAFARSLLVRVAPSEL